MALKDTKLEEKEQLVVRGTILADEYRDRKSGKLISGEGGGSETNAIVHDFVEGTILTDEILSQVKSGDIVKVANMEFVVNNKVNQSPRSITGKIIGAISGDTLTIVELNWINGQALSPTMKNFDISDEFDRDVTIQIATSGDSTFGDPITYEEWAEASKEKEYEVGTIIKFNNLNKDKSYRLIATDLTHGEGTKWELYDIVAPNVQPILPFDALDYGEGGPAGLQSFLDGDDTYIYPSNKHGYQSAQGFKQTLDAFFAGFPYKLKRDIRLTEIGTYIPRNEVSDNWGDFGDQSTKIYVESEGEDGLKFFKCYAKLYLSSAQEVGNDANPGTDSTNFPSRIELVEWDEDQQEYVGTGEYVYPEGEKDDYYDYGNGTEARAKRVKYFNGQPYNYWLRSPSLSRSDRWGYVSDYGNVNGTATYGYGGLAPAFRV